MPTAMSKVTEPWSACQQRHPAAISEFMAGKSNPVAHCLSHVLMWPVHLEMDFSAMAGDQPNDLDILNLGATGFKLKETVIQEGSPGLLCDVSTPRRSWLGAVGFLTQFTLSGTPGFGRQLSLLRAKSVWPGLRKDVNAWAAAVLKC